MMLLWGKLRRCGLIHQPADSTVDRLYGLRREQIRLEWVMQHLYQPFCLLCSGDEEEHVGGRDTAFISPEEKDVFPVHLRPGQSGVHPLRGGTTRYCHCEPAPGPVRFVCQADEFFSGAFRQGAGVR